MLGLILLGQKLFLKACTISPPPPPPNFQNYLNNQMQFYIEMHSWIFWNVVYTISMSILFKWLSVKCDILKNTYNIYLNISRVECLKEIVSHLQSRTRTCIKPMYNICRAMWFYGSGYNRAFEIELWCCPLVTTKFVINFCYVFGISVHKRDMLCLCDMAAIGQ